MSFSGFGNNNNTTSGGFGGFGSNNQSGFGANNNTSTSGSLFGGNTATSGGFGGFGSTANSNPFGASKPAFGASTTSTTGGSIFGGGAAATNTGFGANTGFGGAANTTSAFGANTGGGMFGQSKPATGGFGAAAPNTTGSLFGNNNNTTSGFGGAANNTASPFGASTTSGGFGASNTNTGFGGFGAANANANANNNGTAATPFSAFTEKDTATSQNQAYQSITFNQPYTTSSFEELRLQDYAQGRRYATSNGQAGSFGTSTGFGGFGATNNTTAAGTGFGGAATANTNTGGFGGGFGAAQNTNANPFGGNTGGGLFGASQNKPATGGLFGQSATPAATTGGFGSNTTGGNSLFGNNTGGFGANANNNTSGGLFGNNQQTQAKPAFGGFGATNNAGSAFGNTGNTTTNAFGANANTTANTGGGLFGNNNQQQQANPFGASTTTGGGLFGNQAKPAGTGLFGNTNTANTTGGGLFGAQNNQQQQSNPFGASTNTGGGLFGNQAQNKPAGTGLFGSTNNASTGTSLFGNNQQQQAGSSLFGGNNANTGGGLFGNQAKPAGTSLFGNTNSNNASGGLFGSQNNQQQNAGNSLFGSMNQGQQSSASGGNVFGNNMVQSQQPAQNQLHASLTASPYGNEQLFSSLAAPSPPVGPLATPLSGARPTPRKTQSLLASAKINTPVYSPRGNSLGRAGGYGFNYSTYGTPGSAFTAGSLTPGASSLLRPTGSLSSALTSRLGKSFSTSNLRGDLTPDTPSLLRPGSFTPGSKSNSMRRLKIDRNIRTDLFGPESKQVEAAKDDDVPSLRKRVSFNNDNDQSSGPAPSSENALVRTETDSDESPALLRAKPAKTNPAKAPEMEQVNGALSTVPEDTETPRQSKAFVAKPTGETGDYWTKPAMKDLRNMSRQQLQNVGSFSVGRTGVGRIEFGRVDLTTTPLDDICGTIVQLNPRSATVYQDDYDKPSVGKALNVPSTIYLENSWPRSHGGKKPVTSKSGKDYEKHIARLKRVAGTHFLDYNPESGVWSFKVDHFTTYELDDEDDETELAEERNLVGESSVLSDPPETPTDHDNFTLGSMDGVEVEQDDTFHFKKMQRSQVSVPGGFDSDGMAYNYDDSAADALEDDPPVMSGGLAAVEMEDPFISLGGAVQAPSPAAMDRYHSDMMEDGLGDIVEQLAEDMEQDVPGSFAPEAKMPRSILKPSTDLMAFTSPEKFATDPWEDQLQRTMSPKKRDRLALKDMQQSLLRATNNDNVAIASPFKMSLLNQSALGQSYLAEKSAKKSKTRGNGAGEETAQLGKSQAFRTAMDLMDSMYAQDNKPTKTSAAAKSFEYPYPKKPRLSSSDDPQLHEWHDCLKPSFATSNDILVYSTAGSAAVVSGDLSPALLPIVDEHKDVRFANFVPSQDVNPPILQAQKEISAIDATASFPISKLQTNVTLRYFAEHLDEESSSAQEVREKSLWELCSILFDPLSVAFPAQVQGVPEEQIELLADRIRMDVLGAFWARLTLPSVQTGLKHAKTGEERALLLLTAGDVEGACRQLVDAKDFKLATMVAQLPSSEQSRAVVRQQITVWRERNDWAEMSDAVRALYSVLAGDVCVVQGKAGASENRIPEFNLAEQFGLTWLQSFALRLFFEGRDSLRGAVRSYMDDVADGNERVAPTRTLDDGTTVTDTLFEILRLAIDKSDPAALFDPRAVSGSPINTRLAWQLASALGAKGLCDVPATLLEQLTVAFATELEVAAKPVSSAWALLHLADPAARERSIGSLLNRNGHRISTPGLQSTADESSAARGTFEYLTEDLQIPAALVFAAKALWAQAGLRNPFLQTNFLLRAGDVEQAHDVLLHSVGPICIIERDYDALQATLDIFEGPSLRPVGWDLGGRVYGDFLRVVRAQLDKSGKRVERGVHSAMQRLRRALSGLAQDGRKINLEEKVARVEMERVLVEAEREWDGESREVRMGGVEVDSGLGADFLRRYQRAMGTVV